MDEYTKELHDLLARIIRKATTPMSDGGIDWDDVTAARALLARIAAASVAKGGV